MKKIIRLTESDLHHIVKESVKKVLDEVRFGGESLHDNPTDWSTIEKMRDFKMNTVPMSPEKERKHGSASLRDEDNALERFRNSQDLNIHPDIYTKRWRDMRDNASKKAIRMQKNLGQR